MADPAQPPDSRRAGWWLAIGAALGLGTATVDLLIAPGEVGELAPGIVARVEGTPIRDEAYQRLVAALASDRRSPLTDADRRRVLDRMIDEELLVQHAVALGLVTTDRRVRADLVTAVLAAINAGADTYAPDEDEIAAFYAENTDYFARPARVHVRRIFVSPSPDPDAARARADAAAAALRSGEAFDAVRERLGDPVVAPVPDAPLPPAKLREYLGPSALEAALALPDGGVSAPIETPQGLHVLQLVRKTAAAAQPLAEIRTQVVSEMKRREGDRRLRERLDELRSDADVVVAPTLPKAS